MPPKKKGNKKAQDDWEADLGESIAPQDAAEEPKAEEPAAEEDATGGGLMAALAKRGKKKGKKNQQQDWEAELGEDPTEEAANDPIASKAPEEANFDDDDVFAGNFKPKKEKKEEKGEEKQAPVEDDAPRVKTKAEKEKEKKEKEKQRKKEMAAKKKATGPAKTEATKPAEAKSDTPSTPAPEPAAAPAAAGGKKGKKIPAALAALQKQQEERRKREEEIARLEAEEKARIEEEERNAEEEEKKKAEARALKKQKEKEKIEQLKKEGKYLTKAQKEAKARNELRLKQMLESGNAKVDALDAPTEKKKPVYDDRKKRKKTQAEQQKEKEAEEAAKKLEELRIAEEQAAAAEAEAQKAREDAEAKKGEGESDSGEDWEAQADAMEGVKDSWDADSDAEEEKKKAAAEAKAATAAKPAANGKPAAEASADDEESSDEEDDSDDSDDSSSDEEGTAAQRAEAARKAAAAERRKKQHEEALAARSKDNLRSPICCILGHVDTGKTKLLDKIRQTNVQEGEAGGITQQIGATYFPVEALEKKTAVVNKDHSFVFNVPGLLVIDTPGHESFTNLRSRGSSLCNIAILVVDIMHGLEPQTLESMRLLRDRRTPFIVALNKIDRLLDWKKIDNNGFEDSLSLQKDRVKKEFEDRWAMVHTQLQEQGFNSELFFKNKNMSRYVSVVPTSAHTGEGIPDMIKLIIKLTQERMTNNLMYLSEVECTVLEVKVIEGLGTTIDVILSNGVLHEGDRVVLCGNPEPIATNIRALLTPAEMKELRVKSQYVHNKEVKAAMGIKIAADGLDQAIAGSRLLVVGPDDDEEDLMDEVMGDLAHLLSKVSKTGRGVSVQASTLGSLEALLEFLRVSKIPVATISIGPVFKKDVLRAGVMLEKAKEYAVMLCFDVKVDKDARAYADEIGVKIFEADIIYHLFDKFTAHMKQLEEQRKEDSKMLAVFPCVLSPIAVFNKKDPIVLGVDVTEGNLKITTPIAAIKKNPVTGLKEIIDLGRVTSIERDHKQIQVCKKGQPSVAVKIEGPNQPLYGRHLEEKDILYSHISRESIDTLKNYFRADVSMDEWKLIKQLKESFDIM
ncbi:eukaryotic translation initiation factor 5B [Didymosphaeria variabile]|uniref:Eukaryotic translation initiation factor 5B n=1 Tax=Didymosphaeria variabile TaxID=1932322 RepID=A0A9W8XMK7_9PLEO|nr:eukaryotic translation initiation factor 5B [Didymosphaeria variabile]KAJ4354179.1 eukaryotic translation initiation factor 5B [Didymosphaeria variabile]